MKTRNTNKQKNHFLDEVIATQVLGKASTRLSVNDTAAQYALKHGDLLLHILEIQNIVMVGGVDIQNVVCHGTSGVIYLLHNVESRLGECLGNTGQKTGVVLIDNGKSDGLSFSLRQRSFREVDRVLDGAVLKEVLDGVGSHGGGSILGLLSGGTKVGKDNGVLVVPAKIIGEVSDISAIATVKESLHGLGIHELATSKVEEDSIALAVVDDVSTNDTVGASLTLDVRDVETDVIGISAGSLDAVDESDLPGKLKSTLDGKTGVIYRYECKCGK